MKEKILILLLILTFSHIGFSQDTLRLKVFFEFDSFNTSEKESLKLIQILNDLNFDSIINLNIVGFCDDIGGKKYNDSLSLKRAQNVAEVIENKLNFINISSCTIAGKGQIQLKNNSNLTIIEERKQNRRTDIELIYSKDSSPILQEKQKTVSKDSNQIEIEKYEVGDTIRFNNIMFQPGLSKFQSESYNTLKSLAESLKANKEYNIKILGHINYTYANPYNFPNKDTRDLHTGKPLSVERAKAVYNYLVTNGIEKSRLSYEGLGGMYPIIEEDLINMRVEIEILKK